MQTTVIMSIVETNSSSAGTSAAEPADHSKKWLFLIFLDTGNSQGNTGTSSEQAAQVRAADVNGRDQQQRHLRLSPKRQPEGGQRLESGVSAWMCCVSLQGSLRKKGLKVLPVQEVHPPGERNSDMVSTFQKDLHLPE